jgi:hypothetical protein
VVAAGAQDLEEDQPGSQSAEHVSTLPGREDRSPPSSRSSSPPAGR